MASITSSVLKRASRLVSAPPAASPSVRGLGGVSRTATAAVQRVHNRRWVSESRRDNAQVANVKMETAVRPDKAGLGKAGLAFDGQQGSDAAVAPVAGRDSGGAPRPCEQQEADSLLEVLKQATVMDEGQRPIYLDMQATTPVDPRVLDAMMPYYVSIYGNPHSRTHAYGWESEKAVEEARAHVARLVGADPKEIVFTSGATESNNMSIKGVARFFGRSGKKRHIVTSQTEHKCVLDSCRHLQDEGFDVTYLPVLNSGLIDMKELEAAIRPDTALVSIMAVNNEIGVIQPLEQIGTLCREKKTFFHTDAAQAVGKIPLDVNAMNIDLMSISSHKIYGPMGIGACYVRRRPRVRIDSIISGGGQERGLRSGTLAPPLVVGFGEACRIAKEEMPVSLALLCVRLRSGRLTLGK